jgi:hypothetical protein
MYIYSLSLYGNLHNIRNIYIHIYIYAEYLQETMCRPRKVVPVNIGRPSHWGISFSSDSFRATSIKQCHLRLNIKYRFIAIYGFFAQNKVHHVKEQ